MNLALPFVYLNCKSALTPSSQFKASATFLSSIYRGRGHIRKVRGLDTPAA